MGFHNDECECRNGQQKPLKRTERRRPLTRLSPKYRSLDGRYRQIGISAVAAAVRYQGVAKNPAYAPAPTKWQDYTGEAAA